MYEHPIKRAGLSFNRILFSNTKMVSTCFQGSPATRYNFSFNMKSFENGKEVKRVRKLTIKTHFNLFFPSHIDFTSADLDDVLPPTKKGGVEA